MVANTAGEFKPNKVIATATANSKKLEVPIKHAGPAIFLFSLILFLKNYKQFKLIFIYEKCLF